MYAVIKAGGKQYRVSEGEVLSIDRLASDDAQVSFEPLLVVDGSKVLATSSELGGARVSAKVLGESRGKKIRGFTYKNKSNQRRHWGHRSDLTEIEITAISV